MALRSNLIVVAGVGLGVGIALWHLSGEQETESLALLETVCADCHNDTDLAGEMSFSGLSLESIPEHPEIFEATVGRLRGHLMPPPGSVQVSQDQIDTLIETVEHALDSAPRETFGQVRSRRLSRTEYARAVQGLLGVDLEPTEYLPTEIEVEGFTNIASALSVSPAFIEQYVNMARTAAHLAVGEPQPKVAAVYFPPPSRGSQLSYVDGFPLGTRGGMKISHTFPADGEYRLTLKDLYEPLYPSSLETQHTLVILVDGEEQFRQTIGGPEDHAFVNRGGAPEDAEIMARFADIPLQVSAGVHELTTTFIERSRAMSDDHIGGASASGLTFGGASRVPSIRDGVDLLGPFESTGLSRTASRELIFVCEPEVEARERECAEQIAANLARRAFRRPATQADLDRLMPFYEEGRLGPGGFDEGVELLVMAVLTSPDFLYQSINPNPGDDESLFALDGYELATRLSFFLWSQGPDDRLLELAEAGSLTDPEILEAEARRMLSDRRAEVLVANFALPWLGLDDLDSVVPDEQIFAGRWNDSLRSDFEQEIEQFVGSILLDDQNVKSLLTADHTFLNERLARHYGVDGVFGPQFRRVALSDETRHGLLGKGAVLLRTSYGDRTSPVLRGAWVLEKLMGTPPTPPPPGVETDLTTPEGEEPRTIRARLEQHREAPNCNACHGAIDPYGMALENFTAIGSWRDFDRAANAAIDATTELPGGRPIEGPVELRNALLERDDQFVQALTSKLMMYALGRELEHFDMPEVRSIVRTAEAQDYRFSAIVAGIVQSEAFRMQATAEAE